MRAILCCLLLAAAPPPALPFAQPLGVATLAADAEARWVPFDLTPGNQIRFAAQLDGQTVTAVLDTGVSYSVVSDRYAGLDRSRVRAGGLATAIGGAVPIGWIATTTLAMGGLTRQGGGITVAALPPLATGGTGGVDLLVGRDLIGGHALDIDYAGRRLRLLASGRLPFAGLTAPLTISAERQVFETELRLAGARLRPVVVDTGDGGALTISAAGWRHSGMGGPMTTGVAYGLGGSIVSEIAVAPELRLGDLVVRHVEVRIERAGGFSDTIGVAGRIGSGLLQNYRVLLDPKAGRMVLRPGPNADMPPLRSTSGLLFSVAPDRLSVLHVMRGGPAAASGWREGEQICAVDRSPIRAGYATTPLAAWSIDAPGRVVTLGLCGGGERRLRLARFY